MIFLAALLAMLWDQLGPPRGLVPFDHLASHYSDWVASQFGKKKRGNDYLIWGVVALLPALLVGLTVWWLDSLSSFFGLLWASVVLYMCVGFSRISDLAAELVAAWQAGEGTRLPLLRVGYVGRVEHPVHEDAVHLLFAFGLRRAFGELFWFVVLGPAGALLYAMTVVHSSIRSEGGEDENGPSFDRMLTWLDWLPARLLALSFALVGNFEVAIARLNHVEGEAAKNAPGLLAGVARGALGLPGDAAGSDVILSAAVLMKRAAVLWLGALALFWLGTM